MKTAVKPQKCPNVAGDGVVAVAHFDAKMGKFARSLRGALSAAFAFLLISGAFADPSFSIDSVQQRYPWDGTVDIHYTVEGIGGGVGANLEFYAKKDGGAAFKATNATVAANGSYVQQWNPGTTTQTTNCTMFGVLTTFKLESGDYLIVDLRTGEVSYENMEMGQAAANAKYNSAVYKTTKMVFRRVPAGTYYVQNSTLTNAVMAKDYYIGIFEVTTAQYRLMTNKTDYVIMQLDSEYKPVLRYWQTFRGTTDVPESFAGNLTSGPIYTLNRTVAEAGGNAVFDFPTEAMWEVAARAIPAEDTNHVNWKWFFGSYDTKLGDYAQYEGNSGGYMYWGGSKLPNSWGIYDIYGNAPEWCLDGTGTATWTQIPNKVGNSPGYYRCRGGSSSQSATECCSSYRGAVRNGSLGFRLACICP